jgi:hypothetical protein
MQSVYLELVPNKGWRMVDRVDGLVAIPWNVDDASTQGPPHGLWITQDRGQALLWELRPLSVMA